MGIKNAKKKKKDQSPPVEEELKDNAASVTVEEQPSLIETEPTNSKEIIRAAKKYKAALSARVAALAEEIEAKTRLLTLTKEANLAKLEDGTTRYHVGGFLITIKPRDELVRVKDENEQDDE